MSEAHTDDGQPKVIILKSEDTEAIFQRWLNKITAKVREEDARTGFKVYNKGVGEQAKYF